MRSATESVPLPQLSDPLVLTKVKESAGVLPGLAGEPRRDSGDPLGGFEDKAPVPVAEGAPFVQPGIEAPVTAPLAEPDSADPAGRPKLEVADEATALFQLPALGAAAAVPAEAAAAPAGSPMPDLSGNAAPPLEAVPLPTAFDGISQPTEVLESFDAQALAAAAREGASVAEAVAPPVEVSPPVVERASDVPEPASLTDVADHDRRKRHRGIHPAAWGLIAMCAALGGVAAWIFLSPSPPSKDAVASVASSRVVTVSTAGHSELHGPAASASAAGAGAVPTSDQAGLPAGAGALGAQPEVAGGTTSGVAPIAGTPSGAVVPDKSDKPGAKVAAPCDPKTDPLCSAVGGPDAGAGPGGRADSGAGLTQEQISATVSRNRGGVQRGCIPLVQSGAVKVNVTMTIGPSGNVSAVSTSGGGGNSGVVACIRSKVSGWHFPASGGTTQVSVPFQLIAQN